MRNKIKTREFPVLLAKIHKKRKNGLLMVVNHTAKHGLFFRDGAVIHAITNREEFKLANFLEQKGILTRDELEEVLEKRSERHLGPALIESGRLDEAVLQGAMNALATEIILEIFKLPEFTIHFENKPYNPAYRWHADLHIPNLIVKGIRRMAEWETVFTSLKKGKKLKVQLSDSSLSSFETIELNAEEGFLLSRIHGEMSLKEILTLSHLDEEVTLKIVYGMLSAGLLERCGNGLKGNGHGLGESAGHRSKSMNQAIEPSLDLEIFDDIEHLCALEHGSNGKVRTSGDNEEKTTTSGSPCEPIASAAAEKLAQATCDDVQTANASSPEEAERAAAASRDEAHEAPEEDTQPIFGSQPQGPDDLSCGEAGHGGSSYGSAQADDSAGSQCDESDPGWQAPGAGAPAVMAAPGADSSAILRLQTSVRMVPPKNTLTCDEIRLAFNG